MHCMNRSSFLETGPSRGEEVYFMNHTYFLYQKALPHTSYGTLHRRKSSILHTFKKQQKLNLLFMKDRYAYTA